MSTRPQDFVLAALYIIAMIGPALAGLAFHLVAVSAVAAWKAIA